MKVSKTMDPSIAVNWIELKPGAPFGVKIWFAMQKRHITPTELSKMVYLCPDMIRKIITGKRKAYTDQAIQFAEALDVELNWLIGLSEEGGPV